MKKVKFFTLGCKVNQYETQGMRESLLDAGFQENHNDVADIYIINTCTVTAQADHQCRRLIRKVLHLNPQAKIIVTGCYVEKDSAEILKISDKIQIVPQAQKHRIVNLLDSANLKPQPPNYKRFIPLKISAFQDHERAFVKIQDGCSNFCSYCKVPLVRGRSSSRKFDQISQEVERLVKQGFKEIVLSGICLGDYHYRKLDLVDVLTCLEKIEGEFRIRLSSIEPQLINDELIAKIKDAKKVCPHLHIPLQSGDNAILKRMNRHYTAKDYLCLISKIKKQVKNAGITTDVLVGFPGEKEKSFCNTISCLKEISPLRTHIFSFSPRLGTRAFSLDGRTEPRIVKERVNLLKEIAKGCSYKFRKRFLGKKLRVLIESQADKASGLLCGYAENYIRVSVENAKKEDVNNLRPVEIKEVNMVSTRGRIREE